MTDSHDVHACIYITTIYIQALSRSTEKLEVKLHFCGNRITWQRDTVKDPYPPLTCQDENELKLK